MRRNRAAFAVLFFAVLGWGAASAAESPAQKPFDLYARGDYAAAIAAGEKENDGEGLAVAARAVLADANLRDVPCLECLKRAESCSLRAIAADPKRTESYVYYAISLGYEARIVGMLRARFANFPEKAKQALDTALMLSPDDAWTLAALGGWNIEVVRNGGGLLGGLIYGADIDKGVDYFHRSFAADPGSLVLRFQYALSLSGYDLDDYRQEIEMALQDAAGDMPRTSYETIIKMRSATLLALLRENKRAEYRALVDRFQGYP